MSMDDVDSVKCNLWCH